MLKISMLYGWHCNILPDNAPLLMLFADACLDDGLLDEAEQSFQRALKDDPAHADARLGLARVALLQGKTSGRGARRADRGGHTHLRRRLACCWRAFTSPRAICPRPRRCRQGVALNRSLADPGIEKDLHGIKPSGDDNSGRKRGAMTSSGIPLELVEEEKDDDDGHPRGGCRLRSRTG